MINYCDALLSNRNKIMELFKENVPKNGEPNRVERRLGEYLKQMKENFFHGILLGILGFQEAWSISSNKEAGDGYSDILIETEDGETGIILELKYAQDSQLEKACREK